MAEKFDIQWIQRIHDTTWILMAYFRDKRHRCKDMDKLVLRKGVPQEVAAALVELCDACCQILTTYNTPDPDFEGDIPTEVIAEIDITKEDLQQ